MTTKKSKKIKIQVEVPKPPGMSGEQIADLKERLACAVVLSYPERLRRDQVIVQNIYRHWSQTPLK